MSHDYPTVSVLMPVRNGARYLGAAGRSILRQTLREFEFIIVDGGSTDATSRILQRWARRDPRVRVLTRPGSGIVDALNAGLAVARAPLIARMDADDVALPQRLFRQAEFLDRHPEFLGCGTAVGLIDRAGSLVDQLERPTDPAFIDAALMRGDSATIIHPSLMVRRAAIEAVGGYRKFAQYTEDLDLYLRLCEHGALTNLPDLLLHYRVHFDSTHFQRGHMKDSVKEAVLRDACRRRGTEFEPETLDQRYFQKPPARFHREWAQSALRLGHRITALKHAFLAATKAPTDPATRRMFRQLKGTFFHRVQRLA